MQSQTLIITTKILHILPNRPVKATKSNSECRKGPQVLRQLNLFLLGRRLSGTRHRAALRTPATQGPRETQVHAANVLSLIVQHHSSGRAVIRRVICRNYGHGPNGGVPTRQSESESESRGVAKPR
ncbi:hypothetical protein J6590_002153 [Homalodisca vitripennis]|nr:hypothetical protein J6590_002153 [Homalodisca vitripennis]